MRNHRFDVTPTSGALGAEILGIDLAEPLATPIGPACRICERPSCPQRAAEPLTRSLAVDDFNKSVSPYPFTP